MREIKFRAWDNVKDRMYYLGEEDDVVFHFESNGIVATDITENEEEFRTLHHLKYMQHTGLKDKNGKEIYEGDVLKFSGNVVALGIVKYNENFATFQACNGNSGWLFGNESGTSIEIIGNVYENLDLVGASK
ncbi:hypothetical protein CN286_26635 [Bacillus anthracis]|nr:hypothetical protein CN286_26635 [Bacillus anthracis]